MEEYQTEFTYINVQEIMLLIITKERRYIKYG